MSDSGCNTEVDEDAGSCIIVVPIDDNGRTTIGANIVIGSANIVADIPPAFGYCIECGRSITAKPFAECGIIDAGRMQLHIECLKKRRIANICAVCGKIITCGFISIVEEATTRIYHADCWSEDSLIKPARSA